MMKFRIQIDSKIRELSEDKKLIEGFDLELDEVKRRHHERQ